MKEYKIADYIMQLTTEQGFVETKMPGVRTFIANNYEQPKSFSYDPCLIIVGQGRKVVYFEQHKFHYNEKNYLVLPTVLPLQCETFASPDEPLVNLIIDIDVSMLKQVIEKIKLEEKSIFSKDIIHTAEIKPAMEDAIIRLLKVLQNQQETDILAKDIIKEIYYRALKDSPNSALYAFAEQHTMTAKISQTLNYIHKNLDQNLNIETLADLNNMSVSSFHKYFKQITGCTPVQSIKKTRLTKARDLIELNGLKANIAASMVGYDSYSQFSREYKRMYGFSPKQTNK